ncbi:MAG: right-handed parallel beta-helix repeat-containing protein [Dehalococcoidia bacterium]|nr:MAG: right-handed parallel beta-helix repeat-containing protein [Dehalococcoidia bacterium]
MKVKAISTILIILFGTCVLTLSSVPFVGADPEIRIYKSTQLMGDVYDTVRIMDSDDPIVLDLGGNSIISDGHSYGIIIIGKTDVTIMNGVVTGFSHGIHIDDCERITINEIDAHSNYFYGIVMARSSSCTISDNTVSDNGDGITVHHSNDITVSGNIATQNDITGINLNYNTGLTVSDNSAFDNGRIGIALYETNGVSPPTTVIGNEVINNGEWGIRPYLCEDLIISDNMVDLHAKDGIWLYSSDRCTVSDNWIKNSDWRGILLTSDSDNNKIYDNNIIDNTIQAYDFGIENAWNNSWPSGGNYWSDYTGVDQFSGKYQTDPDSDGFGDTPYSVLVGSGQPPRYDYYPLMGPHISTEEDIEEYLEYVNDIVVDLPDEIFISQDGVDISNTKTALEELLLTDSLPEIEDGVYEEAVDHLEDAKDTMCDTLVESEEKQELFDLINNLIEYLLSL